MSLWVKKYEITARIRSLIGDVPGLHKMTRDEVAKLLAAIEQTLAAYGDQQTDRIDTESAGDDWDGEGSCPKCQGDDCDPEGGCRYDD